MNRFLGVYNVYKTFADIIVFDQSKTATLPFNAYVIVKPFVLRNNIKQKIPLKSGIVMVLKTWVTHFLRLLSLECIALFVIALYVQQRV